MAAIAGITAKKNTKGQLIHITIDVKKMPLLYLCLLK